MELGFSLLCLAPNHSPVSEGLDPGYRGRRGGGEEPWAGRDPRRPTGHAVLGLERSLAGSKKQVPSCSPSPLPASHHHPRKGVQAVLWTQAWSGPMWPTRRPGSFLERTRVLEKVGNGKRCMVLFGFSLQVLIFFFLIITADLLKYMKMCF